MKSFNYVILENYLEFININNEFVTKILKIDLMKNNYAINLKDK